MRIIAIILISLFTLGLFQSCTNFQDHRLQIHDPGNATHRPYTTRYP